VLSVSGKPEAIAVFAVCHHNLINSRIAQAQAQTQTQTRTLGQYQSQQPVQSNPIQSGTQPPLEDPMSPGAVIDTGHDSLSSPALHLTHLGLIKL